MFNIKSYLEWRFGHAWPEMNLEIWQQSMADHQQTQFWLLHDQTSLKKTDKTYNSS